MLILLTVKSRTKLAMKKKLLLKQIFTYFNRYILSYELYKEYVWILFKVFFLIIMVVIIYMVNIFTTRENRVLSFNSSIQTTYRRVACAPWGSPSLLSPSGARGRSYSDSKIRKLGEGPALLAGSPLANFVQKRAASNEAGGKNLDPNFVTGLVDAEGSFMVFIKLNSNNSIKLVRQIQLSFEISLHIKDIELLYKLKSFFGEAGTIFIPSTRKDARLKITALNDIFNFIIPHFKQYPLQGMKSLDYDLWFKCAELLLNKEHLHEEGLNKILSLKSMLNNGLSDKLKLAFPNVKTIDRPVLEVENIPLNPNYVSGFTEGDGCFTVNISSKTNQVIAYYIIELHKREITLLTSIQKFFDAGSINLALSRNTGRFYISKKSDLITKVLPHFDVYKLEGNKLKNYLIFREIVLLLNTKAHLTQEGFNKIKLLKEGLNK